MKPRSTVTNSPEMFTEDEIARYRAEGFLIVADLLAREEADQLREIAAADREMQSSVASRDDGEGGAVKLVVRNRLPQDTIYGAIVRSDRIVRRMEQLLDDEVYHWHHKMILKEPRVGGAWTWHQDYGYWYNDGCLLPKLASCMIAVDEATVANGCLQVIRGSHRLGRIDHLQRGDQTGADMERIEAALKRLELVHVELRPGSAVFFDCNLLHRSDRNKSEYARWAFIACYNARSNSPFRDAKHPSYSPLEIWPHSRIKEIAENATLTQG